MFSTFWWMLDFAQWICSEGPQILFVEQLRTRETECSTDYKHWEESPSTISDAETPILNSLTNAEHAYHIGLPLIGSQLQGKEVMVQLSMKTADQVFCNITAFAEKLNHDPDLHCIPAEHSAAIIQATYVCSGCDYTLFFAGCGKTAFFAALYQYSEFITSGTLAPGLLCREDEKTSLLAFYRLVGCVYFKRYMCLASYRPVKNPYELFQDNLPIYKFCQFSGPGPEHWTAFLGLWGEETTTVASWTGPVGALWQAPAFIFHQHQGAIYPGPGTLDCLSGIVRWWSYYIG